MLTYSYCRGRLKKDVESVRLSDRLPKFSEIIKKECPPRAWLLSTLPLYYIYHLRVY